MPLFGFRTATGDCGAGYAGLTLLANFRPDVVKLDKELVRGIDPDRIKRALVRCVLVASEELGVDVQQGYLFAKPGFETPPLARPSPRAPSQPSAQLVG